MTKKLMQRWVKALRSKKFEQGDGYLYQENTIELDDSGDEYAEPEYATEEKYCCLGVLGSVCGMPQEDLDGVEVFYGTDVEKVQLSSGEGKPKDGSMVRVRMPGLLRRSEAFNDLASANDAGASFKAIAQWIEKNYKKL